MAVIRLLKRTGARAFIFLIGLAAIPLVANAQGYCWGNCPSNAIRVCTGIVLDGYCVDNPTQEQLDRHKAQQELDRERKEQAEKERLERERIRIEREQAEKERIAAEEKRKVDVIANQIGPGKQAAAEKLSTMNEQLRALRPKPRPRQCASRSFSQTMSNSSANQGNAYDRLMAAIAMKTGANITGSESVVSMTATGAPSCSRQSVVDPMPKPPVGDCLACISESQAKLLGYIPGKGWPPPNSEWVCKVAVQVVAEKCSSGPSSVTSQ
jgi:hypothetical protein